MDSFREIVGNPTQLWDAIKSFAIKGGRETTKILLELYYVMIAKETSTVDKMLIGAAIAYQTVPSDLLPRSKYGLLGFFDNAAALLFAYNKIKKAISPDIEQRVNETLDKWFGVADMSKADCTKNNNYGF